MAHFIDVLPRTPLHEVSYMTSPMVANSTHEDEMLHREVGLLIAPGHQAHLVQVCRQELTECGD
jgi:hypothetical protein